MSRSRMRLTQQPRMRTSLRQQLITISISVAVALTAIVYSGMQVREVKAAAVTAGDYRSKASGNWNQRTTWEIYDGTTWVNAVMVPSALQGHVTICAGHTILNNSTITNGRLLIEEGGRLMYVDGAFQELKPN